MKTIILDSATKSIKATLSGLPTTTNPDFISAWGDSGIDFVEGSTDGSFNGVTAVTIVAAPAASTRRIVKALSIQNKDTAPVTLTLYIDNNGTQRNLAVVTLQVGDTWTLEGTYDSLGCLKQSFAKNFGVLAGDICEGNDARLSNSRTPTDASTTYAKVAVDLVSRQAIAAVNIDWSSGGIFTKAITGSTTFTFSNPQLNKVITLIVSGAFSFSIPVTAANIQGTANTAKTNKIQIHCTNATAGSEEYWAVITTN